MGRVLLIDQDNVLADFEKELYRRILERFPEIPLKPLEQHKEFYFSANYNKKFRGEIISVMNEKGFILSLPPVEGGLLAIKEMLSLGMDVRICTAPLSNSRYCAMEKYEWVSRHLGSEWKNRVILSEDKTFVRGAILVDDKPVISGAMEPEWEHVVFDQPYNRHITNLRRLVGWENWKNILLS